MEWLVRKKWWNICYLNAGPDLVIGRELFSSNFIPDRPHFSSITGGPGDLVRRHGLPFPGVYCIAADNYLIRPEDRVPRIGELPDPPVTLPQPLVSDPITTGPGLQPNSDFVYP